MKKRKYKTRTVNIKQCLATTHPWVLTEWDTDKNGNLTPYNITYGVRKTVYWKCEKGHSWSCLLQVRLNNKKGKSECPECKKLSTKYPIIAKEWYFERNGKLTPSDVAAKSSKVVWWKCKHNHTHIWKCRIASRTTQNIGCPFCSKRKVHKSNCLATIHPNVASQWHKEKNGDLKPSDVFPNSLKRIYWQCKKNKLHVWRATCHSRNYRKTGCPYCAKVRIHVCDSISIKVPELMLEWHPTLNGKRTPYNVGANSILKVWWICKINPTHIWKEKVYLRTAGKGCFHCKKS